MSQAGRHLLRTTASRHAHTHSDTGMHTHTAVQMGQTEDEQPDSARG